MCLPKTTRILRVAPCGGCTHPACRASREIEKQKKPQPKQGQSNNQEQQQEQQPSSATVTDDSAIELPLLMEPP
ncbi:hypothetical protein OCJ37_11270 [Xanthomonas sp. AM6]|uniref:hypothetical protein n=1 Tax=Xanthomonas sp. AM6 TaxID=2982531 RepID=UPI0021DAD2BB|nr:hypothetical protein [Xanthomonas sp. AM6]UYB50604.1 hypothetical protein OCJ37_11270 [Xanthomonas sp. AM6]